MSIESLTIALNHSKAKGATKIVLLGVANHDGDGGAWPSVKTLARYANVSERMVQIAIGQLEDLGEIRRHVQAGGDHRIAPHERPNRYDFLLECPPWCDRTSKHRDKNSPRELPLSDPVKQASPGETGFTTPVKQASPKPSSNQPKPRHQKETHLGNRARAICGHDMIPDGSGACYMFCNAYTQMKQEGQQ